MIFENRIVKNLLSLAAAEISAKGFAFITTFYLARILEPENWSVIIYSKSLSAPFILFVSLGIDTLGTREISRNHSNTSSLVNSILSLRIFLSFLSYAVFGIISYWSAANQTEFIVLMTMGLIIFGNASNLHWVYQGLEKMHIIALRAFTTNSLILILVFLFVRDKDDLIPAALIMSVVLLLNSILMFLHYRYKISKFIPKLDIKLWKSLILKALPIGLAFFVVTLYNNVDIIMLKWLRNNFETGIYGAGYSLVLASIIPSTIIQGSYFPSLSRLKTIEEKRKVTSEYSKITILVGGFVSMMVFVYADLIVSILGDKYEGTELIIKFLMIGTFFIYISLCYYIPLLSWNLEKKLLYANLFGLAINIILNSILIVNYGPYGAVTATIISELAVLIYTMSIFNSQVQSIFLANILKFSSLGIVSGAISYLLYEKYDLLIISFIAGLTIFVLLNIIFKTIRKEEILHLLKRKKA